MKIESSDIIGQPQAIALLEAAIAKERIAPAYLFSGPEGVGRALTARWFARLVLSLPETRSLANHPDFLWVEPTYQHKGQLLTEKAAEAEGLKRKSPPQIRLEQVRDIAQFLSRPPLQASRSLVVVERSQTMAEGAANALLKTLEEPGRATIILIAPSAESLLPTLVSRCQKIPFYRLSMAQIKQILQQTGNEIICDRPEILSMSQGSPGNAIVAWEQLQAIPETLLSQLSSPPTSLRQALTLAKEIARELDSPQQLWLIDYLQQIYWQNNRDRDAIDRLERARKYLRRFVQPRLVWEVTLASGQ